LYERVLAAGGSYLFRSCRVAGIAGLTIINVAAHIFMFIIHLDLAMFMAIDAGEFKKISGTVTIGTG
jgi:hypothetical protein